jgi:hypothetical protein
MAKDEKTDLVWKIFLWAMGLAVTFNASVVTYLLNEFHRLDVVTSNLQQSHFSITDGFAVRQSLILLEAKTTDMQGDLKEIARKLESFERATTQRGDALK